MSEKLKSFRKSLAKSGVSTEFSHIDQWLSFPSLAMNWVVTGSFRRGIPNRRTSLIGGVTGATKSMQVLCLAREAQDKGYHVCFLDSEGAISEQDLQMNGVRTDEEYFTPITVTTIEEVTDIFTTSLKELGDERIMFILDSASGLFTDQEIETLDKGNLQNDMGLLSKKNKALFKSLGSKIRDKDWFFLATGHIYLNQEHMSPDGKYKFSNLGAAMYYPSVTIQLTKLNLKEGQEQTGIKVDFTTRKTRFNQVGKKIRLELPYKQGKFWKYEGVLQILKDEGFVKQAGAWYSYEDAEGKEVKFQSKTFEDHAEFLIDRYEEDKEVREMEDDTYPVDD